MHQLIYISRDVRPLSETELVSLLQQARYANEGQGITGALIYGDGQFMQVIEGEEAALALLYAKLLQDPRHQNVVKLADKQIAQRNFSEWSMAFQTVDAEQFATLKGYVPPEGLHLEKPGLSAADTLLLKMMKVFIFTLTKD